MKHSLLVLFAFAYSAYAVPVQESRRYIDFPDGNENIHRVDLLEEPDYELLGEMTRNPANNQYLLFTRRNPEVPQTLVVNQIETITLSNFNPNVPTIVVAHGWLSSQDTGINPLIRDASLLKDDVNVIILDWRRLARAGYVTAANGVIAVGRGLAQFLATLNRVTGAPYSSMHLVGFSLGAHLVGSAGRELNGQIARITALDPAGPLWTYNSNRVSAADALYVEGIHTDGNTVTGLGIGTAIGHADFFPNGGTNQPGCLTGICDHNRAWELFSSSIEFNHFKANECASNFQVTWDRCRGQVYDMGNNDLSKFGRGIYRVNTSRRYPF